MLWWYEKGRCHLDSLVHSAPASPTRRILRTFRRSEAMEIGQITEHRWLKQRANQSNSEVRLSLKDIHNSQDTTGARPHRPPNLPAMRLAITGAKESGKTIMALHLSHYLALRGWRILLLDLDPQAALSRYFDADSCGVEGSLVTHIDGLDFYPSTFCGLMDDFAGTKSFLRENGEKNVQYHYLDHALVREDGKYDIIVMDTSHTMSFTTLNAIHAATGVVITAPLHRRGAAATMNQLKTIGAAFAPEHSVPRWDPVIIVPTMGNSFENDEIRSIYNELWASHVTLSRPEMSKAIFDGSVLAKSVYEMTAEETDRRKLIRARENADAVGNEILMRVKSAWACRLLTATG